jgi:NAD(P)-dependent dehydrogenase (short-subunit alcohol dehydrogenase family)
MKGTFDQDFQISRSFRLDGLNAYVTGGGRGIGKACALGLAEAGANVAIIDIEAGLAEETAGEIGRKGRGSLALECDVTDSKAVKAAIETVAGEFGSLDIAFNNAGICIHSPAEDMTDEDWLKVIEVNLNSVFYCARAAGKLMINQGRAGSIINTASMSARIVNHPQPQAAYNASKAAVKHLSKSLATEWAPYGIRVNSISPGYTGTGLVNEALARSPEWERRWLADTPMGRLAKPEEIAGPVVFLASAASSFVTGHDLVIDGGFTCW